MVFRSRANPGFRIDGATQVIVQVRAFRHFLEQVEQLERICARSVQIKRAASFSFGLTGSGVLRFDLRPNPRREKQQKTGEGAYSPEKDTGRNVLSTINRSEFLHLFSSCVAYARQNSNW